MPSSAAEWTSALATGAAVVTALSIATREGRRADERVVYAQEQAVRQARRRRQLDQMMRLLTLIETDRQALVSGRGDSQPRSPEAVPLALIFGMGLTFEYYIKPDAHRLHLQAAGIGTPELFEAMRAEVWQWTEQLVAKEVRPEPDPTALQPSRIQRIWAAIRH